GQDGRQELAAEAEDDDLRHLAAGHVLRRGDLLGRERRDVSANLVRHTVGVQELLELPEDRHRCSLLSAHLITTARDAPGAGESGRRYSRPHEKTRVGLTSTITDADSSSAASSA